MRTKVKTLGIARALFMGASIPLFLATSAAACSKRQSATLSSADAGAQTAQSIEVDPTLLDSGRIRIAPVERRQPRRELRVPGEVRAHASGAAEVGALVSGRVASILVDEGSHVRKGDVLAWIDAPEVARATADLVRARSRAELAKKKLARQLALDEQGATSKTAIDEARAEEQAARADIAASRTLLASLGGVEPAAEIGGAGSSSVIVARVPIRTPIDGTVTTRDAQLGAPVSPDKTLFRIVGSAASVVVIARVPETAMPPPPSGSPAMLVARTPDGQTCDAIVRGDSGVVDPQTRTIAVRVEPTATTPTTMACRWLSHGGYVDVVFGAAAKEPIAIVVPKEALVDVHGVPSVFVAQPRKGAFVLRTVRTRGTVGPDAIIEDGLVPGENVAVEGAILLKGDLLRTELEGS